MEDMQVLKMVMKQQRKDNVGQIIEVLCAAAKQQACHAFFFFLLCLHEEYFAFCTLLRTINTKKEHRSVLSKFAEYMQSGEAQLHSNCCSHYLCAILLALKQVYLSFGKMWIGCKCSRKHVINNLQLCRIHFLAGTAPSLFCDI